jgi:hypothetical protein
MLTAVSRGVTPAMVAPKSRGRALFLLVLAGFAVYAALFIYRTSFVISGERYFSLFDDAMVSMRYARNLADGYGLVWNPAGERVEGYTNPAWVLYMALVHLIPVSSSKTSLFIQVTAAVLLAFNLYWVRRVALAVSSGSQAVAMGAVVLTASYLPLNNWSLQGMEVSVLVLLTSACAWLGIRCLETGTFPPRLYLLLGLGTLVRPDMAVTFMAFLSYLAAAAPAHRRKHLWFGLLMLAVLGGAQTLLRLWYYGDVLPNTYYLKMTGVPLMLRISRGLAALLRFVWRANVLLVMLAFAVAARPDKRTWLLVWIVWTQMAYSVYVGGDAWEYWGGSNRYICIVMPAFFILLSRALYLLASALMNVVQVGGPAAVPSARSVRWTFAVAIAVATVNMNSIYGVDALAEALLVRAPLHTGTGESNHREVEAALELRRLTTADATVAVTRAGTIPYFSDRIGIDLLGKTDSHVARGPARMSASGLARFVEFRPGHMKFDYAHSIGREHPDLVVQLWRHVDEARPFLEKHYEAVLLRDMCVYARRGSPRVAWDRLTRPAPADCDKE